jgi:putative transposase
MVQYRRNRLPGGCYFFTVTLSDRRAKLLTEHIDLLRQAFREVRQRRHFAIDAIVVLPEHLHTIWMLPAGDADYTGRWRAIKALFSRRLQRAGIQLARRAGGEHDVWQRRFWEHTIRNDTDLQRHVDYIHYNPVRHRWVGRPTDWPYSSIHRYIRQGLLPENWAVDPDSASEGRYGE